MGALIKNQLENNIEITQEITSREQRLSTLENP